MTRDIESALAKLSATLREVGEDAAAGQLDAYMSVRRDVLEEFLRSNELWGGSGSIADQAGVGAREKRRKVESALIELGAAQVSAGITNVGTVGWVEAFKQWRSSGV